MIDIEAKKDIDKKPPPKKVKTVRKIEKPRPLYEKRKWHGIIPVYVCLQCETSNNDLDDLKTHILSHYPRAQREAVLEKLIKE